MAISVDDPIQHDFLVNLPDKWLNSQVTLSKGTYQVSFTASKGGNDPSQPYGDIALDDIILYNGACDVTSESHGLCQTRDGVLTTDASAAMTSSTKTTTSSLAFSTSKLTTPEFISQVTTNSKMTTPQTTSQVTSTSKLATLETTSQETSTIKKTIPDITSQATTTDIKSTNTPTLTSHKATTYKMTSLKMASPKMTTHDMTTTWHDMTTPITRSDTPTIEESNKTTSRPSKGINNETMNCFTLLKSSIIQIRYKSLSELALEGIPPFSENSPLNEMPQREFLL